MTATITNTAPLTRWYLVQYTAPIANLQWKCDDHVYSEHAFNSPEFNAQFQAYAENCENSIKGYWANDPWVVRDPSRNMTYWLEQTETPNHYIFHGTCVFESAVFRSETSLETTKEGEELLQAMQEAADFHASIWPPNCGLLPIPPQ